MARCELWLFFMSLSERQLLRTTKLQRCLSSNLALGRNLCFESTLLTIVQG